MYYNYFRNYDPSTGRYLESDLIGLAGGVNTYVYVKGSPLSFADFPGLTAVCPAAPPFGAPNWKPYVGNPWFFHCGYDTYLENRNPTPEDPIAECVYSLPGTGSK